MYMRVDSNTRGHHQWFFFKVQNQQRTGAIKFNVVNFTKHKSLYMQGMHVNVKSKLENEERKKEHEKNLSDLTARAKSQAKTKTTVPAPETMIDPTTLNEGWEKGGLNISYKLSKLSTPQGDANGYRKKRYF